MQQPLTTNNQSKVEISAWYLLVPAALALFVGLITFFSVQTGSERLLSVMSVTFPLQFALVMTAFTYPVFLLCKMKFTMLHIVGITLVYTAGFYVVATVLGVSVFALFEMFVEFLKYFVG